MGSEAFLCFLHDKKLPKCAMNSNVSTFQFPLSSRSVKIELFRTIIEILCSLPGYLLSQAECESNKHSNVTIGIVTFVEVTVHRIPCFLAPCFNLAPSSNLAPWGHSRGNTVLGRLWFLISVSIFLLIALLRFWLYS